MAWRRLHSLARPLTRSQPLARLSYSPRMENRDVLPALDSFAKRHVGPSAKDRQEMLRVCGVQVSCSKRACSCLL